MIAGVQKVVPRPLETGMSDGHSARWGFSLVELLVSLGVISTLLGFIAPAIQASRESSRRLQCLNHMRQFAVAEHSFESAHGHFPEVSFGPSDNIGLVSRAILSHHYSLLPYLDQTATFQQVDVSAGLQSSLNTPLFMQGRVSQTFHCFTARPTFFEVDATRCGSVPERRPACMGTTSHPMVIALWVDLVWAAPGKPASSRTDNRTPSCSANVCWATGTRTGMSHSEISQCRFRAIS